MFSIFLYVVFLFLAGESIYRMWQLTRIGNVEDPETAKISPVRVLGSVALTLVIVIFFGLRAPWGSDVSIMMWWLLSVITSAYAGVAIWRILRDRKVGKQVAASETATA